MSTSYVDIDPDADTLIILPHQIDPCPAVDGSPSPLDPGENDPRREREDTNATDSHSAPPQALEEAKDSAYPIVESRFKVSMKHLTMAARRAKVMFTGHYVEAQPEADGLRHWKFEPIFDPSAFEIVMDAIHGHTQKLPKAVTIKTMAGIAAVVDDLACHRALWFFAKIWIDQLRRSIPSEICDDLTRWILVSFVFDEPELFKSTTRVAILEGKGPLSPSELPIRPKIIEMIDAEREGLLEVLVTHLHSLVQRVCQDGITCESECKSIVLGTLIHEMMSTKLFLPKPSRPFVDLSLSATTEMIREFQLPTLYHSNGSHGSYGWNSSLPCGAWVVHKETFGHSDFEKCPDLKFPKSKKKKKKGSELIYDSSGTLKEHTCHLQELVDSEIIGLQTEVQGLELSSFM
ncbi:hypothetical protein EDB81DRAFT_768137 [Dactylonectria macrodidyma]|uniref:BTB domain-containing protein n=1 Tax=Dactylonectria macrodidyma TaxID=307937 RepID=A0A9P9D6U0_9HYPO|nr:hypothetical protein EDB81DRAFT_768137 [Dactylonectria macrodidyma]